MGNDLIGASEMERLDREAGIAEVCEQCGVSHWAKAPICADCHFINHLADIMDAEVVVDEPLSYEQMAG